MKRVLVLVTVAACNQVYGLDSTILVDAPPPDAPPACGPDLVFRLRLQQAVIQPCSSYSIAVDTGRAIGFCSPPGAKQFVGEGPVDAPLLPINFDGVPTQPLQLPRLAPEGDRMFLGEPSVQGTTTFGVYYREGSVWRRRYSLPVVIDLDDSIGTPSRRPNARFLHARPNASVVDEYIEDAPDTWRRLRSFSTTDFDTLTLYTQFNLTADGLHVVFQRLVVDGSTAVAHAWRDTIDAPFGQGVPIMGVPRTVRDPFMTLDCERIYFSGLGSIFYAQQQ